MVELSQSLLGVAKLVHNADGNKGAAFYDNSSGLQTLLKDLVNEIKNLLNVLNDLVEQNPLLEILLGKRERAYLPPSF
jgi:hypothetical protein